MYSFRTRVRYSELAPDKKLSLVSIINYFQDSCTFEAEDKDIGLKWLADHHTAWMLTNWQIHVLRKPKYCEEVDVLTWATDFKYFIGKRSFLIRSISGEPLVFALSEWAYMNTALNKPEKNVPDKELEAYGLNTSIEERFEEFGIPNEKSDDLLKGRIDISHIDSFVKCNPITVSPEHLDTNDHLNNAQYVAIASAVLPKDYSAGLFRAEYKMQSRLGDVLIPCINMDDDKCTVVLMDKDEKAKLICEFYRE